MARRQAFSVRKNVQLIPGPPNWYTLLDELEAQANYHVAQMQAEIDQVAKIMGAEGRQVSDLCSELEVYVDLYEGMIPHIERAIRPRSPEEALPFLEYSEHFRQRLVECTQDFYVRLEITVWRIIDVIIKDLQKLENDVLYSGRSEDPFFRGYLDDCWASFNELRNLVTHRRNKEDFMDFWKGLDIIREGISNIAVAVWGKNGMTHLEQLPTEDVLDRYARLPAYRGALPRPELYLSGSSEEDEGAPADGQEDLSSASPISSASSDSSWESWDEEEADVSPGTPQEEDVDMESDEPEGAAAPVHRNADLRRWAEMTHRENLFDDPYCTYLHGIYRLTRGDEGPYFRDSLNRYRLQRKQHQEEKNRRLEERRSRNQSSRKPSPRAGRSLRL